MNNHLALSALLAGIVFSQSLRADAGCACCEPSASAPAAAGTPASETAAPVGHPLRGVIVEVLAEKQALLVKHEEIPGVMRAMTMLLKTDAPTLAAAKKGQSITATLVRKSDGWWIENVKTAEASPSATPTPPPAPETTR